MKQIIYRKKPLEMFYLHMTEGDTEDIDAEMTAFKEKHPSWDIYMVDWDADMVMPTIIKESHGK